MKIVHVGVFEKHLLNTSFQKLEKEISYPLGEDKFQIDHGNDYFSFFNRLGIPTCYAAVEKSAVIATGMGILRNVPFKKGEKPRKTWYLCDLKVSKDFRGRHLPLKILRKGFLRGYLQCARGYAISMNPTHGNNRIVKLLGRFPWAPSKFAGTLNIYSCDDKLMKGVQPVLEKHRGPITYLSLSGKKDLVLKSTGTSLPLLHVQFGTSPDPKVQVLSEPAVGFTHMFCCPAQDPLTEDLETLKLKPHATASIIQHRMSHCDWKFILTSDI